MLPANDDGPGIFRARVVIYIGLAAMNIILGVSGWLING
jgi:hypothetical protein